MAGPVPCFPMKRPVNTTGDVVRRPRAVLVGEAVRRLALLVLLDDGRVGREPATATTDVTAAAASALAAIFLYLMGVLL